MLLFYTCDSSEPSGHETKPRHMLGMLPTDATTIGAILRLALLYELQCTLTLSHLHCESKQLKSCRIEYSFRWKRITGIHSAVF